jgi:hypothetical protein
MLKLYGVVNICTNTKIYISGHDMSLKKVKNVIESSNNSIGPVRENVININYKMYSGILPDNDIVGKKVQIMANIKKYKFKSKFNHNKDDIISGFYLQAVDIKIDNNWSN